MAEEVIMLKNVSCLHGKNYLIKNINWNVKKGEHWLVFGMNGCGKTTLLSIIAGYQNYLGEMSICGKEYNKDNISQLRRNIGFVSASFFDKFFKHESVINIVLSGLFGNLSGGYITDYSDIKKAKRLLMELHLGDKMNKSFDTLSKGEQQNVLIARALITEPSILVLDEPGTGLDVLAREYLLQTIKDFSKNKEVTIIYVTHYVEEILDIFEHCMLMKNGDIFNKGLTNDIFSQKNLEEFLTVPINLNCVNSRMWLDIDTTSRMVDILKEKV